MTGAKPDSWTRLRKPADTQYKKSIPQVSHNSAFLLLLLLLLLPFYSSVDFVQDWPSETVPER